MYHIKRRIQKPIITFDTQNLIDFFFEEFRSTIQEKIRKAGVTADRDKIEFRLFNSSSILNITFREELFSSPKGYIQDRTKIKQSKLNLITVGRDFSFP